MGTATLLEHLQIVCAELALPQPTSIVGSSDSQIMQLLALANREGKYCSQLSFGGKMGWQDMVKTATYTLANGVSEYPVPSDMHHAITATFWDVNYRWQLLGPLSPIEFDVLVYGISPAGPRRRFRVTNNKLLINPVPGPGDVGATLVHEYYTTSWCQSATSTLQSSFQADTDTYLLDDDSMQLGIKWRFLRAKGLDYTEEKAQYMAQLLQAMAVDGFDRYLPTDAQARQDQQLLSEQNVPDTGFGA